LHKHTQAKDSDGFWPVTNSGL